MLSQLLFMIMFYVRTIETYKWCFYVIENHVNIPLYLRNSNSFICVPSIYHSNGG